MHIISEMCSIYDQLGTQSMGRCPSCIVWPNIQYLAHAAMIDLANLEKLATAPYVYRDEVN